MFRPKRTQEFSFIRTSKKLLTDRESIQRIKHLRCIIDNASHEEIFTFFKKHYSLIFNAFYDVFMNVQMELQQKATTSHCKELQNILSVFEKILLYLPELINKLWQFNCIISIISTLLNPDNIYKIRLQGMQLFLIIFQIIGNKAPKACIDIYVSLIPAFESIIKQNICCISETSEVENPIASSLEIINKVHELEIKSVLTQNFDKENEVENENEFLLKHLLMYMVSETKNIEWDKDIEDSRIEAYNFLFEKFKEFFLPAIFPKCSEEYSLEQNQNQSLISVDELQSYSLVHNKYPIDSSKICCYQEEVICWLAELITIPKSSDDHGVPEKQKDPSTEISFRETMNSDRSYNSQNRTGTMETTYTTKSDKEQFDPDLVIKMQNLLFNNDDNVNLINQICQHAFYLPLNYFRAHSEVIEVYKSWMFASESKQPSFLADKASSFIRNVTTPTTDSLPVINSSPQPRINVVMQKVIFNNVSVVFMHNFKPLALKSSPSKKNMFSTKTHSDLVKRILKDIFRKSSTNISNLEYEHLMNVMLDICFKVLSYFSPTKRPDAHWINNNLCIGQFFQTLNVLLIKSNLAFYISNDLWNRFLSVYSSLTDWQPLIDEWRKTVDLLLRVLGRSLYNVDMNDLPLEKKEKRGRRVGNVKKPPPMKNCKSLINEDSLIAIHPTQNIAKTDQTFFNSSANKDESALQTTLFIESLNQNSKEHVLFHEPSMDNSSETKNEKEDNVILDQKNSYESPEYDRGSFVDSSHEENSSYQSAEESSSPHCKEKSVDVTSGIQSDSEILPLSSCGCDTSLDGNSFNNSDKQLDKDDIEDTHIDADDESEGEFLSSNFDKHITINHEMDSKSATLTREESDVDITSGIYAELNDSSRTPTKALCRRKNPAVRKLERNSINIEENIDTMINNCQPAIVKAYSAENLNTHHIILGGTSVGWSQESSVIIWKRFISLLGDVTKIKDIRIMMSVFEYFSELTDSFIKMRENMSVTNVIQSIDAKQPQYIPPICLIIPWLFETFEFGSEWNDIKLISLKILCKITVRKLDIHPSIEHLSQFYKIIHSIVQSGDMTFISTLIEHLGCHFFSISLAGSEILILDVIKACEMVLDNHDEKIEKSQKTIAVSLLCSLIKFQDSFDSFHCFDSTSKDIVIVSLTALKKDIVRILLQCIKQESNMKPRLLSIVGVTLYTFIEINYCDSTSYNLNEIQQNILQILSLMRFNNLEIASMAVQMIRFLVVGCAQIQEKLPHIPEKIIQVLSWTIRYTWNHYKAVLNLDCQRLLISLILTLVDWCMSLPLGQLLDSNDIDSKGLVHSAFVSLDTLLAEEDFEIKKFSSNQKHESFDKIPSESKRSSLNLHSSQQFSSLYGLSSDPLSGYPQLFEVEDSKDHPGDSGAFENSSRLRELVKLASRAALCHLINHIGQFPKNNVVGSLSSCIQEHHDFKIHKVKQSTDGVSEAVIFDDLTPEVLESPDLQMFVINNSMIVSLLLNSSNVKTQFFNESAPGGPPVLRNMLDTSFTEPDVRIIVRDLCGKFCWDVTFIHKPEVISQIPQSDVDNESIPPSPPPRRNLPQLSTSEKLISQKSVHGPVDNVDELLMYLNGISPEMFQSSQMSNAKVFESQQTNLDMIVKHQIIEQNCAETNLYENFHTQKISHPKLTEKFRKLRSKFPLEKTPSVCEPMKSYYCRQILMKLGFLSWRRRSTIDLINKSKIFLHLKNLDQRRGRETHKFAVLYVGWGQEDKDSILGNTTGSLEFNNFVKGLGWTINLETHKGFLGGLDPSGRDGHFAPYYATSTVEVMFHVSTWMPSEKAEDRQNKFKHLGNDEVMIIWSENYRDYRSNITRTEFGDIMIIIYPLRCGLFGISIRTKNEFKLFGPLFDGAIVGEKELPGLVRATAINAGRLIREKTPRYQEFFIERADYLEKAIKQFCEPMTFEDFAKSIYGYPVEPPSDLPLQINPETKTIYRSGECSDRRTSNDTNIKSPRSQSTYKMPKHFK